jgi:hypothetical protein
MNENGEYVFDAVPEGTWNGEYCGSEEKIIKWKDAATGTEQSGPMLEHKWNVEVNGKVIQATNLTPLRPNPKNLFGKLFKLFEGHEIQPQDRAIPKNWLGKKALLIFEIKKDRSKITNILPFSQKRADAEAFL